MRLFEIEGYTTPRRSKTSSPDELFAQKDRLAIALNKYRKHIRIYRGLRGAYGMTYDPLVLKVDPRNETARHSANTSNHYTLLFDNLPSWSMYPKRSQSLVCTTHEDRARGYGTSFAVLPFDDPSIGICSSSDFWEAFGQLARILPWGDLASLNYDMRALSKAVLGHDLPETSFAHLKRAMNAITKEWRKINFQKERPETYERFHRLFADDNDLFKTVANALDPQANKIALRKLSRLPYYEDDREVWLSAPCFLVRNDYMDDLVEEGKI